MSHLYGRSVFVRRARARGTAAALAASLCCGTTAYRALFPLGAQRAPVL
ncbi:MAG TPA: hypothetical protein VJR24_06020 [Gemmatimonadaceae bacterium]|nr:hypothetical protein [Gemmatimonadaceae bacterium]